jgi:putative SOS response-associated peptidase YedK
MCGRFALKTPVISLRETMHFDNIPPCPVRYNIAPSQEILVVRQVTGRREGQMMRWGLIPSWTKDPQTGHHMINARAESLADKPAFREAFRRRRCLVPADGFYEWQNGNVKRRQPFFIQRTDGQVMTLAGIWDPWVAADGQSILSCSIITVVANATVGAIHNRMPAILEPSDADRWLDESLCPADLLSLLRPPAVDVLEAYPVDRQVNKPDEDGSACIRRIEIEPTGKLELF